MTDTIFKFSIDKDDIFKNKVIYDLNNTLSAILHLRSDYSLTEKKISTISSAKFNSFFKANFS